VLHYCAANHNTPSTQACPAGTACGWSATEGYYDCVTGTAGPDPSGRYPIACVSSGPSSTTSTGAGGDVTWTDLYNNIFGPTGSASCVSGGGCHTLSQSGFKCGTSASACYTGIVNSGYVIPGTSASTSTLVDPSKSPLCGSLGGNMPKGGACVTTSEITQIKSWLAAGAQNN
jgi:hypothetical protein